VNKGTEQYTKNHSILFDKGKRYMELKVLDYTIIMQNKCPQVKIFYDNQLQAV